MKLAGQERPAYFLYHSLWWALDWLFPPTCGGCSRPFQRWCPHCQGQIERITGPICICCGEPLSNSTPLSNPSGGVRCSDCQAQTPEYEVIRSYGIFGGPLREALHRLKYQRDVGLGDALSKHLIELYNELCWDVDLVAPVPLSMKRARERGYNQSGLLARPLAYAIQKPYQPGAVRRNRETRSQVELNAYERRMNVQGAFIANRAKVNGKVILVIDDVMTTGSTISACAQALREAGASAVYGLTLARAAQKANADLPQFPPI